LLAQLSCEGCGSDPVHPDSGSFGYLSKSLRASGSLWPNVIQCDRKGPTFIRAHLRSPVIRVRADHGI